MGVKRFITDIQCWLTDGWERQLDGMAAEPETADPRRRCERDLLSAAISTNAYANSPFGC